MLNNYEQLKKRVPYLKLIRKWQALKSEADIWFCGNLKVRYNISNINMIPNLYISLLLLFPLSINGQDFFLELKAIERLCNEIDQYRDKMKSANIYFNGKITSRVSPVFDVAYCFGDITWQEYMEQNSTQLDSIRKLNKGIRIENHIKIKRSRCRNISRFPFFKRRKYSVLLNRSTHYFDNKSSVLITMFHKPTGHFILFSVLFDSDNLIIDDCFSSYTID